MDASSNRETFWRARNDGDAVVLLPNQDSGAQSSLLEPTCWSGKPPIRQHFPREPSWTSSTSRLRTEQLCGRDRQHHAQALEQPGRGKRSSPDHVPSKAPAATAGRTIGSSDGRLRTAARFPARPAIELTRMNTAATPDVRRGSSHRNRMINGLRKIPPPVPVSPASSPSPAPAGSATANGGGRVPVRERRGLPQQANGGEQQDDANQWTVVGRREAEHAADKRRRRGRHREDRAQAQVDLARDSKTEHRKSGNHRD